MTTSCTVPEARLARGRAELYLKPVAPVAVSAGEAVTWENKADEIFTGAHARIIDTLDPDFQFRRGTFKGVATRGAFIHAGWDAMNATTEGDTLWVKKNTSRFSSRSTDS